MSLHDFCEKTEQYVVDIINGRQTNTLDMMFRHFLFVLSRLYRNITQLRLTLYDNSLIKQHELGCTVISVGNLTTGGTGKTPVVELLAKTLAAKGRHVAILSRGYRSKPLPFFKRMKAKWSRNLDEFPPKVVSNGREVLLDSQNAGDEPFMLASNLLETPNRPGVAVVVDKDRVKGGNYAITRLQADTLILDDGFQYLRLRPLHNILLVDSTNPFNNHEMLPAGLLREPIKNLRRANVIFITKSRTSSIWTHGMSCRWRPSKEKKSPPSAPSPFRKASSTTSAGSAATSSITSISWTTIVSRRRNWRISTKTPSKKAPNIL